MAGEATITIPGTQTKVPKWAPLAAVGVIAAILLLKPKASDQGDFNEEGTAEEEGAGVGSFEDLLNELLGSQGLEAPGEPMQVGYSADSPNQPVGTPPPPWRANQFVPERTLVSLQYEGGPSLTVRSLNQDASVTARKLSSSPPSPTKVAPKLYSAVRPSAPIIFAAPTSGGIQEGGGANSPPSLPDWLWKLLRTPAGRTATVAVQRDVENWNRSPLATAARRSIINPVNRAFSNEASVRRQRVITSGIVSGGERISQALGGWPYSRK
jgi:hypothetical protein